MAESLPEQGKQTKQPTINVGFWIKLTIVKTIMTGSKKRDVYFLLYRPEHVVIARPGQYQPNSHLNKELMFAYNVFFKNQDLCTLLQ